MAAPLLPLPPDEVHLWYLLPDDTDDPGLMRAYEALLAPAERARRDRYHFEKSRREYLLTRALVRTTLSRYAPLPPAAWTFSANAHGRPEIALPEHAWLRFNLSNTEGLIACIVARDREVGVDVEDTERRGETTQIAEHYFSPTEVAALRALPEAHQRRRFFDYWTLKEAYIKARGLGLAIPLDHFSFHLQEAAPIRIAFDPRLEDDAASWQFAQFSLTARHQTSVAVRRGTGPEVRFVVQKVVPLA